MENYFEVHFTDNPLNSRVERQIEITKNSDADYREAREVLMKKAREFAAKGAAFVMLWIADSGKREGNKTSFISVENGKILDRRGREIK